MSASQEVAMTDATHAHTLLAGAQRAAAQARARSRASWFPLVVFGLVILGSLPLFVYPEPVDGFSYSSSRLDGVLGGWFLSDFGRWVAVYWLVALPLGYFTTAAYFRRRARRTGLASRPGPLVLTGVLLLAMLVVVSLQSYVGIVPGNLVVRGLSPLLTVAVGLIVLAVSDRSPALGVIALAFLGISLLVNLYDLVNLMYRLGWEVPYRFDTWPNVVFPGAFLLVCGLVLRRRQQTP
jgi:hypothetical protein